MAGEKLGYVYSAYADASLVGKEGTFVKINGASNGLPTVVQATDALAPDGVLLRGDVEDATVRVCNEGIVLAKASGYIDAGCSVEVAEGKAVPLDAGVNIGKALAEVDASADKVIPILLIKGGGFESKTPIRNTATVDVLEVSKAAPTDVVITTVSTGDGVASAITVGEVTLTAVDDYTAVLDVITILAAYFATATEGEYVFELTMTEGNDITLPAITVTA